MKVFAWILALAAVATACGVAHTVSSLDGIAVAPDERWPSNEIQVCWANGTNASEKFRARTQKSVEDEFNAKTKIKFVGWGRCTRESPGVHVGVYWDGRTDFTWPGMLQNGLIIDGQPRALGLGKILEGDHPGVVLNPLFLNVAPSLNKILAGMDDAHKLNLLHSIAVHEFGHVAGLYHEQNRADSLCTGEPDSKRVPPRSVPLGNYDADSIMNYCVTHQSKYDEPLHLSAGDIAALNSL